MNRVDILVPELPESVVDATVATWYKKPGENVTRNEIIVEIETDKVVLEVPASEDGILDSIVEYEGASVLSRNILGCIRIVEDKSKYIDHNKKSKKIKKKSTNILSPSLRRLSAEYDLDVSLMKGTGLGGRINREDIFTDHLNNSNQLFFEKKEKFPKKIKKGRKKNIPITSLRKCVAERLLYSKNNTAMLTTINEINMQPIIDIRNKYGKKFQKIHGVRLGYISFHIKAVVEALKRYPIVNAYLEGSEIVYYNYFDISIAVSTPKGLVTPVIRDVDSMSLVDIEKKMKEIAILGSGGKLPFEEITGGNFTITNGGVFGSLISTPIINHHQSAILGMHTIKDRTIAVNKKMVILPMMYLALSYDHRIIDGKESVHFLVTVKEILEDPARIIFNV